MKTSTESLGPTRVKLTIEVPFEDFQPSLDKAYKNIGSQIQVPGFRKGKVPAAVVDQRVGRGAVLDEAMNDALPAWYSQAVQEAELKPLSQPEVDLTKFADGEPIEITAELDVRPEITVPDVKDITVEVADAEVTDGDVDEQLEALRERFATFTDVERAAVDGDAVTLDLSAADKDGKLIDGAQATEMPYTVGSGSLLDGLDDAVIGLSTGETTTFETELVGGELKGQRVDITVTLRDVKERELPELDDDFAATAGEFDTVEELKADLRERLTRAKRIEQAGEARDLVVTEIVDKVDVPLPDALVEAEVAERRQQSVQQLAFAGIALDQYLEEQGQTVEEFDAEIERQVRESIVAGFILDEIAVAQEIGLEDNELSEHIMRRAQQSGQDPNSYIQHIMEHNHVPDLMAEIIRAKALANLVESVTVKDASGNVLDLASLRPDGSTADDEPASEEAVEPAETQ
ncbi:MAG TPA: trigger factor [Aeromicrobium sp.]|nr:trigger factor [Aeromicrobium sp.]